MAKKSMNYRSLDSLIPVEKVLDESAKALNYFYINYPRNPRIIFNPMDPIPPFDLRHPVLSFITKCQKLTHQKVKLCWTACEQYKVLLKELDNKDKISSDRLEHLNTLNILLSRIIAELRADLET